MNRGLAISTVLLLLAAIWLPLAGGQEAPDFEFSPDLGDDLAAYGRGYVENLMLWSGAGVHLKWGPSFGGNDSLLDARLAELETAAGGTMPNVSAPLVVPFAEANPAFATTAPWDHREEWIWNTTGVEARVGISAMAAAINAETDLADHLMDGGTPDAEGLLLVQSALEAARFMDEHLGWDGSMLGPINMSDPNMTDTNASNGWWLPATTVTGDINGSNGAWENTVVEVGNTLGGSMLALTGLLSLGNYLSGSDFLVGTGHPFEDADVEVLALANAVYSNIIAVYYDVDLDLFIEDDEFTVDDIAWSYMAMVEYYSTADMAEYKRGWSEARALRFASLLVQLQNDDGTMPLGVSTAVGGIPGAYIPPFLPMPGVASHGAHAQAIAVLYDAHTRYGGMAFGAAADACFAAHDMLHFDDGYSVYVSDKLAETTIASSINQVSALFALKAAVEAGDIDLARYRITQVMGGIVAAGLQVSETDDNGEDYSLPEPDTNNNTIWKHDRDNGLGNMYGIAPVLTESSTFDVGTKNWTVNNGGRRTNAFVLMMAALFFMGMDGEWFEDVGVPQVDETDAYRLVHWTPDDWKAHTDDLDEQVVNLTEQVDELKAIIDNGTGTVDELLAQIASLEENLTAMEEDLNESRDNETVLRGQVDWLRQRFEETNETLDEAEERITVLESQVERLEESVGFKDENITMLQEQLRSERSNVTQLRWQLENASAAVAQAEKDLAAAERELKDTQDELDEQKSRQALVALAALVAGMIVVVVLLKLIGKL